MPERFSIDADIETGVERQETPAIRTYTIEEQAGLRMLAQNFKDIRLDAETRRQDNA